MKPIINFLLIFLFIFCNAQQKNREFITNYNTFGKGKPILIINGGPGMNSEGFAGIAQKIADLGYKTIIYDQRGTGKSYLKNPDSTNVTMDLMAKDIEVLRKRLHIKKWTVLGHSFGGLMATFYASKYPKSIDKIIFSSSGGVNLNFLKNNNIDKNLTQSERDSIDYYDKEAKNSNNPALVNKKEMVILANAYVYNKKFAPIIAQRLLQLNPKTSSLVYQNLKKIKFDFTNQFKNFKQPVLILEGKNDILTLETAEEIHRTFGNSTIVLLDHCAHYGWLDSPELYMKSIAEFLKK